MPTLRIREFVEKSPEELSTYNELKICGDFDPVVIHRLKPNKFTTFLLKYKRQPFLLPIRFIIRIIIPNSD